MASPESTPSAPLLSGPHTQSRRSLRRRWTSDRGAVAPWPFAVAAAAFAAVVITHLLDFGLDDLHNQLFDADLGSSWSHILVAAVLIAATGLALLGAIRDDARRGLWSIATAILAFLAVDEVTPLHTQVDDMSWGKALYAPILAALGVCLWRLSARSEQRLVVRAGIVTLVISFAIHVFGPHVLSAIGLGASTWAYQIKVALKEGTELAGWLLVLAGLWRLG
jgi:hypothetical protein